MTKIRIHRYENEKWGRFHHPWMLKFKEQLSKDFDVEYVNYYKGDNKYSGEITMQSDIGQFRKNPPLSDVDLVVENLNNGEFFVLTFAGSFNSYVVHYLKSDKCLGIFSAHFSYHFIFDVLKRNKVLKHMGKVHPWFFGFFAEFDVDKYRKLRDDSETFNDGLFFKGGGVKGDSYRETINILAQKKMLNPNITNHETYLTELSKQNIGLSHYLDLTLKVDGFTHPGEMCYRDVEMMSIGVPFIRIEYNSSVANGFIPNYHYISIRKELAQEVFNNGGNEAIANLYIKKYNEVKDEKEFLSYISKNQRQWYDENMRWPKNSDVIYNKLNLKNW